MIKYVVLKCPQEVFEDSNWSCVEEGDFAALYTSLQVIIIVHEQLGSTRVSRYVDGCMLCLLVSFSGH